MKKENTKKSLELQILECKKRLKALCNDIDDDEVKSKEYNKIIVQKAILVEQYKKLSYKPSLIVRIKNALRFRKKDKLICDYFLT